MTTETNIKRQHYVWRKYLQSWTINDKLWCKRGASPPFNTSPINVAVERFFYKVEVLSREEFKLVMTIIQGLHPSGYGLLIENLMLYCTCSDTEFLRKNGIEKFHGIVENSTVPILDALCAGKLEILQNDQTRIDFCKFLGRQYTRTKKIDTNLSSAFPTGVQVPEEFRTCDMKKIGKVMSFLSAENVGNWAYSEGKFCLFHSPSGGIITCDQPVSNPFGQKGMALYYPLNPEYALLVNTDKAGSMEIAPEQENEWNRYIRSTAHEMVFSHRRELLE